MTEQADFFQKKLSNTRSFKKQQRVSRGWIWVIIALLLLALGGYGVYRLFFAAPNLSLNNEEREQISSFSLGQEVVLHGELKADGDIARYTHTILDDTYGEVAVKSAAVNLGNYVGRVDATGIVEKFYQGLPIIEIQTLSGEKIGMPSNEVTDAVLDKSSGVYLLSAGMLFLPEFFEQYLLLNEGENGQILIQDLDTDQEIVLNYFRCNPSDPNKNCKGLVETFSQSAARSFVTANGDTFYKQSEVNSRFVANGDWRGIFINDVPEETVFALKDLIVFANTKVMKNWMDFAALRICQNAEEKLQTITDSSITLKQNGLTATIKGNGISHSLECVALVDFSLPSKGSLVSLTLLGENRESPTVATPETNQPSSATSWNAESPEDTTSTVVSPITRNPNVPQFPLNPEKGLKYTSARGGYAIQFPSANISYAASTVQENFGSANLLCSYVISVIQYSEKENLEISPAIRIYECQTKGALPVLWEEYLIMENDGKTFVIQITNPAWIDFANALSFSTL